MEHNATAIGAADSVLLHCDAAHSAQENAARKEDVFDDVFFNHGARAAVVAGGKNDAEAGLQAG